MKSGRKNLKKASEEDGVSLQEGQSIMKVVSLRGSNVIEGIIPQQTRRYRVPLFQWYSVSSHFVHLLSKVMDAQGVKSLALFPAKFHRSFWIKRGNFVLADEGRREKALESGDKIACIVSRVLFHAQVRDLERSPNWPASFRNVQPEEEPEVVRLLPESGHVAVLNSDSDDDLPPLEENCNRRRPVYPIF